MIIAVPYQNQEVFGHFGKTEQFLIAEVQESRIAELKVISTEGRGHGQLVGFLKSLKVGVCLCQGMGQGAYDSLTESGIEVIRGISGKAEEAVVKWAAGQLSDDTSAVCRHHDHEGGEGVHACSCHDHH